MWVGSQSQRQHTVANSLPFNRRKNMIKKKVFCHLLVPHTISSPIRIRNGSQLQAPRLFSSRSPRGDEYLFQSPSRTQPGPRNDPLLPSETTREEQLRGLSCSNSSFILPPPRLHPIYTPTFVVVEWTLLFFLWKPFLPGLVYCTYQGFMEGFCARTRLSTKSTLCDWVCIIGCVCVPFNLDDLQLFYFLESPGLPCHTLSWMPLTLNGASRL